MTITLNDLLYLDEHLSCNHYVSDYRCSFRYYETKEDTAAETRRTDYNHLIFLLEGEAAVCFDGSAGERSLCSGEILFLPRNTEISIRIHRAGRLMVCTFDVPNNPCDKLALESYGELAGEEDDTLAAVPIRPQMKQFLDLLVCYLRNGINCEHLHEIKQKEIFLIFRWFYTKEELGRLFRPMAGKSFGFKAAVIENYGKAANVDALARLCGMSRSSFDVRFKEVFGLPPGQWMLKQKAKHVLHALSFPDAVLSEVTDRFGFASPSQFTRFCRREFGRTPTEIAAAIRAGESFDPENGK